MIPARLLLNLALPVVALFLAAGLAAAADLALKVSEKPPPKELDPAISARLQRQAVQLLEGDKPVCEYWFVSEVTLSSRPASAAKALDSVKPAALLGVVSVPVARRDYRDDEIAAGVYTARFALQPQDGNHLGTAEFNYFAVLVPARLDTRPDGITDYKSLVKTSSKQTSADHPVIVSLRPASADGAEQPQLTEPVPEHRAIRVKVPARAGEEKTSLTFEVVFEGVGKK